MVHECLHQKAPKYLQGLLKKKVAGRQGLQSEAQAQLEVPHTKTRPLPVAVSVYMQQPNGTSYPTPLVMDTALINSKICSTLCFIYIFICVSYLFMDN